MKLRVTLITENNIPADKYGDVDVKDVARVAWNRFLKSMEPFHKNEDKAYVESVELLEE